VVIARSPLGQDVVCILKVHSKEYHLMIDVLVGNRGSARYLFSLVHPMMVKTMVVGVP